MRKGTDPKDIDLRQVTPGHSVYLTPGAGRSGIFHHIIGQCLHQKYPDCRLRDAGPDDSYVVVEKALLLPAGKKVKADSDDKEKVVTLVEEEPVTTNSIIDSQTAFDDSLRD